MIPLEPFNLNMEREEGYFDAQGNYIEYALNDSDAWLAAIDEQVCVYVYVRDSTESVMGVG